MSAKGTVVWFTGLPASGKTTLACRVRDALNDRGQSCVLLDGDEVRAVLGAHRYDDAARTELYRVVGALAGMLAMQGLLVLVAATAPRRQHRDFGRGDHRFIEVYVRTSLAICEARDPKGLYARARRERGSTLPGIGGSYEHPLDPDLVLDGEDSRPVVTKLLELLDPTARALLS